MAVMMMIVAVAFVAITTAPVSEAKETCDARGLCDLLGTYTAADEKISRHWRPNCSWFDTNKPELDKMFPTCQHEVYCDALFALTDTNDVQELLYNLQNPPDCDTAKLAILDDTWPSGMGSALHVYGMAFGHKVLEQGRALVTNAAWSIHSNAGDCPNDSTFSCYFLPVSKCKPPAGSFPQISDDPSPRVVRISTGIYGKCGGFNLNLPADNPLSKFKHKPFEWWFPQIMNYILRPQPWVLREYVWPIQHAAFFKTEGVIPHPIASIFVRRGDKGREAPLHAYEEYFQKLEPIATQLGIKHVFVNSDEYEQIEGALQKYQGKYEIHFIDYHRFGGGLSFGHVTSMSRMIMSRHIRLSLADLYITAQADVMVGTQSSNWCRLHDGEMKFINFLLVCLFV